MNILIIDDDSDYNLLVGMLLKKMSIVENYHIIDEPKKALEFLTNYQDRLDCIFLDIRMPVMDGFEFLHTYEKRLQQKFPNTKLFLLTSSIRKGDMKEATMLMSVEGVFTKPLTVEVLQDIHDNILNDSSFQGK